MSRWHQLHDTLIISQLLEYCLSYFHACRFDGWWVRISVQLPESCMTFVNGARLLNAMGTGRDPGNWSSSNIHEDVTCYGSMEIIVNPCDCLIFDNTNGIIANGRKAYTLETWRRDRNGIDVASSRIRKRRSKVVEFLVNIGCKKRLFHGVVLWETPDQAFFGR